MTYTTRPRCNWCGEQMNRESLGGPFICEQCELETPNLSEMIEQLAPVGCPLAIGRYIREEGPTWVVQQIKDSEVASAHGKTPAAAIRSLYHGELRAVRVEEESDGE